MRNGPCGGSSGLSPIVIAALGLLACKAVKSFGTSGQPSQQPHGGIPPVTGPSSAPAVSADCWNRSASAALRQPVAAVWAIS